MTFFSSSLLYLGYAILGFLPSAIWLLFYLNKDSHPEPKKMVFKVFFWGMLTGPAAIILQLSARWLCGPIGDLSSFFASVGQRDSRFFLNILLFAPLIEEYLKYYVVKRIILKNPAFDEPLDAMLYLIISALGFAATENLLNIFLASNLTLQLAASQAIARFLSATLLHTLASGILGYFLARSLLNLKKRKSILAAGFILAVAFHSFYNYLAWLLEYNKLLALALATFLILLIIIVSWQFGRLKKQLSICKI